MVQLGEKQKKMITQLKTEKEEHLETISKLKYEVFLLNSKLDKMSKTVRMLNNGTDILEDILQTGKVAGDMSGLGFNKGKETVSESVHSMPKPKPHILNRKSRHHGKRKGNHSGGKFKHWRCHHCGCFGHIKPFCFKLYGYPKSAPQHRTQQVMPTITKQRVPKVVNVMPGVKKQWVPKMVIVSLIAYTSLRVSAKEDWYFDNGCSRHMTGVKNLLVNMKSHSTSYVT